MHRRLLMRDGRVFAPADTRPNIAIMFGFFTHALSLERSLRYSPHCSRELPQDTLASTLCIFRQRSVVYDSCTWNFSLPTLHPRERRVRTKYLHMFLLGNLLLFTRRRRRARVRGREHASIKVLPDACWCPRTRVHLLPLRMGVWLNECMGDESF